MSNKITIGTAYYPEHWGKERWLEDIRKIKETGMDTLRIAELAWSMMEPEENRFELNWLEEFINLAHCEGMKIILGTPSEASPVWLRKAHPEVVAMNAWGQREGKRGNHCHNTPTYRMLIARMTTKMAERFGTHPAVVGWQIDNEFRGVACYCDDCAAAFRKWLQNKFGTLENLNHCWGTSFWSQTYNSWDEIELPKADQVTISTSQVVDYKRFVSDTTVDFQDAQVEIIRKLAPGQWISHNSLGALYYSINMYDLAKKLDFYAWDTYPHVDDTYERVALGHDLARGTKHDNFWMLEQKNGYFNGSNYNLALEPGIARAWGWQDIARGANGVMYYRWRANRWGQEQNPNGIIRHDGSPRKAFFEIQQLCRELAPISERLAATHVKAEVALIQNYSDIWAHEAKVQYTNISHEKVTMEYYKALLSSGITADLIQPNDTQLSRYKVVIAPNLMLLSKADAENLKTFVKNGGHLVLNIRAGMKDEHNVVVDTPWPGLLAELTGVTVDEFEAFPEHAWNTVNYGGRSYDVRMWADVLTSHSAEVLATYGGKFYKGAPAITRKATGKGSTTYIGVAGCPELIKECLNGLLAQADITLTPMPVGVYMTIRESNNDRFLFLINMNMNETVELTVPYSGINCFTSKQAGPQVTLKPFEVVVLSL